MTIRGRKMRTEAAITAWVYFFCLPAIFMAVTPWVGIPWLILTALASIAVEWKADVNPLLVAGGIYVMTAAAIILGFRGRLKSRYNIELW